MPAHPDAALRWKAVSDKPLTMTGYGATWDLDSGGDLIVPGAFANTLSDWRRTGRIIPLIDMHDYSSVFKVIGKLVKAEEDVRGLLCTFELIHGSRDAEEIAARLKGGHVARLSIGYKVVRSTEPDAEGKAAYPGIRRFLTEITLEEISAVIWPMNDEAHILTVGKARPMSLAQSKALGRTLEKMFTSMPLLREQLQSRKDRARLEEMMSHPEMIAAGQRRAEREAKALADKTREEWKRAALRAVPPMTRWGGTAPKGRIPARLR